MARHALLIGVSDFADKRLARLNAPTNDVIALRTVLQDGARGGFDSVDLSINEDFLAVRDRVSRFFHDRAPDDLLLFYYSGHGILGRGNRLYLATAGSDLDAPRERSLAAKEIREFIEECRAERQVVILDCCHSGAFAEHAKGAAAPAVTDDTFAGGEAGLYVLTAADALQYAWDGAELKVGQEAGAGGSLISRFTSWLVEGLAKGEAAPDDDAITMDALYRYLFRRAKADGAPATPQRFVHGGVGDLVISRNPEAGATGVDPAAAQALAAEDRLRRLGAVTDLARRMHGPDAAEARAARRALKHHLQNERDYAVREAIVTALDEDGAPRPAPEPARAAAPPPAPERPAAAKVEPAPAQARVPPPGSETPAAAAKPALDFETILKLAGAIFIALIVLAMCASY